MPSFLNRIIPFIFMGIMIVLFIVGLVLLSYLLIAGALVGLVLFIANWIRNWLSTPKHPEPSNKITRQGRTIDHNDIK